MPLRSAHGRRPQSKLRQSTTRWRARICLAAAMRVKEAHQQEVATVR
jgi:hypothetical protein